MLPPLHLIELNSSTLPLEETGLAEMREYVWYPHKVKSEKVRPGNYQSLLRRLRPSTRGRGAKLLGRCLLYLFSVSIL